MGATREIHRIPRGNITFAILAGERALSVDGDLRAARYWFDAAYQDAELSGDPELLARAALGLSGVWVHEHRTCADWERVRTRQRHALRLLDPVRRWPCACGPGRPPRRTTGPARTTRSSGCCPWPAAPATRWRWRRR
ncbi:hypothetical protein ACFQ0B_04570 [Nonomuraea thailandensis]